MESLSQAAVAKIAGRNLDRSPRPLKVLTFLAPNLLWFYQFVCRYLAKALHCKAKLSVASDYAQLGEPVDIAFVCGLPYVERTRLGMPDLEPLVAPVLTGERYGGKPLYFSDVIVRRDSPLRAIADLRGRSWAYNEPHSQSGYGIVRDHLVRCGETNGYFSRVIEAGYHERALHMVCSGAVDASAIDSHVLALLMRDDSTLVRRLRVIDALGPSPIQPIVAGSHLSKSLKEEVKRILLEMDSDPLARRYLWRALIERFEPVSDSTYDAIRRMRALAEAAQFLTIR
jgi:phosphonate transport system substrate-binding protein